MTARPADLRFGAGAAWHRTSRWLGRTAAAALFACLGLAVWLGNVSDVNDTTWAGSGWGARTAEALLWNIPAVALSRHPADPIAVALARAFTVVAITGVVAAGAAGLCWLRADRLRKPIAHATPPRHLGH